MSDSDGEEPKAGQKKDMFYKIKALKRRTMHAVAVTTKKAEVTKDPEFDDLYERFEEVDAKFAKLSKCAEKYALAQAALAAAGSELGHAFLELYDKDPMLKKLAVELESIYEYMVSDVAPQLGERWDQQVAEPLKKISERRKEVKEDSERRKRYQADYDHYRSKKKSLENESSKDKGQEKIRENDKKLAEASQKYFSMNERLTARLKIADNNKAAMLNDALMATIAVMHDLYLQGNTGFQKLYATSKTPEYLQAVQAEAEELARLDSQVKSSAGALKPAVPPTRTGGAGDLATRTPTKQAEGGWGFEDAKSANSASPPPSSQSSVSPATAASRAAAPPTAKKEEKRAKYARALFAYDAAAEIELDLKEGDVIKVLKEDDSGWWQGEVEGRVGWFPFNYIEVMD